MSRHLNLPYLKRQLRTDPFTAAGRIIASRNAELAITTRDEPAGNPALSAPGSVDSYSRMRQANATVHTKESLAAVQSEIEELRATFWTIPLPVLVDKLQAIDCRSYPELAVAVERLKRAATIRTDFPNLSLRLKQNSVLFNCIKQSITLPPRDAAGMKEALLRSLQLGANLRSFRSGAELVRREFPQIYELDPEWFDQLQSLRKRRQGLVDENQRMRSSATTWVIIAILVALARSCGTLVR